MPITKATSIDQIIHDFVHSDNPKFAGKSKEERIKMAQGAYYGMHKESVMSFKEYLTSKSLDESKMSELHASIGEHLNKHIKAYKAGKIDADTLGTHVTNAHSKIADEFGIPHHAAKKLTNNYVDSKI